MGLIDTEQAARAFAKAVLLDVQRDNEYLIAGRKSDLALVLATELSYARAFFQERVSQSLHGVFEALLTEPPFAHVSEPRPWAVAAPTDAPTPVLVPAPAPAPPAPSPRGSHTNVCPNCGAPMPITAPNTVQHCRFCEAESTSRAR